MQERKDHLAQMIATIDRKIELYGGKLDELDEQILEFEKSLRDSYKKELEAIVAMERSKEMFEQLKNNRHG